MFSFVKCLFYNFWKDHMDILLSFMNEGWCSVFAVVSDSVRPMNSSPPEPSVHGILQVRMNTRVGCHALLQGIFATLGSNPWCVLHLLHCGRILYP